MENNDFRDVVEPSKIKRMQELLDESYAKGFADGKEEGLRVKRQGQWIKVEEGGKISFQCSCGCSYKHDFNFCPNCGMKMSVT